jgi:hypothetical protein
MMDFALSAFLAASLSRAIAGFEGGFVFWDGGGTAPGVCPTAWNPSAHTSTVSNDNFVIPLKGVACKSEL